MIQIKQLENSTLKAYAKKLGVDTGIIIEIEKDDEVKVTTRDASNGDKFTFVYLKTDGSTFQDPDESVNTSKFGDFHRVVTNATYVVVVEDISYLGDVVGKKAKNHIKVIYITHEVDIHELQDVVRDNLKMANA